ncbi:MAG: HepT-like ribonuclease domain-containing protein [Rickettsiales bacterium]
MSEKINPDIIRLNDILKAISDIEQFLEDSNLEERKTLMAIAYEIAIIGEACGKISYELKENNKNIPWVDIIGMRHRIIHGYGTVNISRIREVINSHLPVLKLQIQSIVNNMTNMDNY